MPARNDPWLNAGPRALLAFTADNADVKFPFRIPILEETHEVLVFDVRGHPRVVDGQKISGLWAQWVVEALAGARGGTHTAHLGRRGIPTVLCGAVCVPPQRERRER